MKKVMLIGGAGYIGSALTPVLIQAGWDVTVVDLFWFGDNLPAGITKLPCDAGQLRTEDLEGFDAVIFLAGLSNDPMADYDPYANFTANASVPAYVAYISRQAGVPVFVHGGSCSVYGHTTDQAMTEACTPRTMTPYGTSKFMAETGVLQQGQENMRAICFRMGTVCGVSPRMRFDLLFNSMVKSAVIDKVVNVFDDQAMRPILDIRDACQAYLKAISDPRFYATVNVLSYNMNIGTCAIAVQRKVKHILGIDVKIVNAKGKDIRSYTADSAKMHRFGFHPSFTPDDTLVNIIEETPWAGIDTNDSKYYNIKRFKELETQIMGS